MTGATVRSVLAGQHKRIVQIIEEAYLTHGAGRSVNPPSYFLRFPERPDDRIIALPASLGGDVSVDGIKWISSFPGNIRENLPRASAVLVLNDPATGYPFACMEASVISATRTAASAALAADRLHRDRPRARRVTFFGTGLIARYIHDFLVGTGWTFDTIGVYDQSPEYATAFRDHLTRDGDARHVKIHHSAESAIRDSELVVFATTAVAPHVREASWFSHNPTVLHVSLRDLSTDIVLASSNVVDDVEHCLKANTSPHLAEQETGSRSFVAGTLYDILVGRLALPSDRPIVFSPFGLGVLDLAVGKFVYDEAQQSGQAHVVSDFFAELSRYA
ncbi:2,3-diaminopropionate biosynthesis protein SbnB [Longimycelium tulufanense]|uniref:2,3-diaminopropionate biosynthesis protein SbnB n=1 Tax=Longimycelium tulufanense TaxID=907463 RepID=UPI0027E3CF57|nr:2,3-diaminopropionate biosynthesis protein SbnB [Longimycelium tulufanense]